MSLFSVTEERYEMTFLKQISLSRYNEKLHITSGISTIKSNHWIKFKI